MKLDAAHYKANQPHIETLNPGMSASTTNKRVAIYMPISDQIKKATQKSNRRSMLAGCLLGAFVPCAVYLISHSQPIQEAGGVFAAALIYPYLVFLILGGLIFSATSVVRWGYQAFGQSWIKAVGFVVLLEGTLVFSPIEWLSIAALIYLVTINALATGTTLALDRKRQFQIKRDRSAPNGFKKIEVVSTRKATDVRVLSSAIALVESAKPPRQKRLKGRSHAPTPDAEIPS